MQKTFRSLFSDAVSEGIEETFKEPRQQAKAHDTV
jgi:hypothetical protein